LAKGGKRLNRHGVAGLNRVRYYTYILTS